MESERQALLNFKQSLTDVSGMLSTWSDDDNNTDCCNWKGIQCNNETSHVRMLHLRGQYSLYVKDRVQLSGAINITSLIHLQYIEYLDLSYNHFQWSHIPQLINSFTNLRYLNLSSSLFSGSIPSELGNLTHLRYLDLSNNDLYEELPYQLGNLSQLRYLDLTGNSISGALPFQVGNLPMLHTLRLDGDFDVKSDHTEWFSNIYSLTNHLIGQIPSSLCEIDGLGKLDLSHNSLSGRIPSGRHFETFEASSFEGYIDLCGEQLHKSCPGDGDGDQTTRVKPQEPAIDGDNSVLYEGLYMSLGFGFFTGFWGLLGSILLWRPWRNAYIRFLNRFTNHIYEWLW